MSIDSDEFKICEPFIYAVLNSDSAKVNIEIDSKSPVVLCNDVNVKRTLDLYLRAGMLGEFYSKFMELLHDRNKGKECVGELNIFFKNEVVEFKIIEVKGLPDFIWKVEKIKL